MSVYFKIMKMYTLNVYSLYLYVNHASIKKLKLCEKIQYLRQKHELTIEVGFFPPDSHFFFINAYV